MAEIGDKKPTIPNFISEAGIDQSRFGLVIKTIELEPSIFDGLLEMLLNNSIEGRVTKLHSHECVVARGRSAFELFQSFKSAMGKHQFASSIGTEFSLQEAIRHHAFQQ